MDTNTASMAGLADARSHGTALPKHVTLVSDSEWEVHKDIIQVKYVMEKKTTKMVRQEMEQLGFFASIQQYERRYRKWGWRKHMQKAIYDRVEKTLKRKLLPADQSEISVNGKVLDRKNLMKAMNRRQPGLYDQLSTKYHSESVLDECQSSRQGLMVAQIDAAITVKPSLRAGLNMDHIQQLPTLDVLNGVLSYISRSTPSGHNVLKVVNTSMIAMPFAQSNLLDRSRMEATLSTCVVAAIRDQSSLVATQNDAQLIPLATYYFSILANNHHPDGDVQEKIVDLFLRPEMKRFLEWLIAIRLPATIAMQQQLLRIAVTSEDDQLLRHLVQCGIDLKMTLPDPYGDTSCNAIQIAIKNVRLHTLKYLLQSGASATECGDPECKRRAMRHLKSDMCCCCCCNNLPIKLARHYAYFGSALLRMLINSTPVICESCLDLRNIISSDIEIDVLTSLFAKSDVRFPIVPYVWQPRDDYCSPLQKALSLGRLDIAQFLEARGADIDIHPTKQNMRGASKHSLSLPEPKEEYPECLCVWSPLAVAIVYNDLELAARYLLAGADPNICYLDILEPSYTPFITEYDSLECYSWTSKAAPSYYTITRCLEQSLEDASHQDAADMHESLTEPYPLQVAIRNQNIEAVKLLFEYGTNLNPKFGFSPLLGATLKADAQMVRLLLEQATSAAEKANMMHARTQGLSPLVYTAMIGHHEIMRLLIDAGARVLQRSSLGITAFEAAIWCGSTPRCLELMLAQLVVQDEFEAWVLRPDTNIRTVVEVAARRGRYKVVLSLVTFLVRLSYRPRASTFEELVQVLYLDFADRLSITPESDHDYDMFVWIAGSLAFPTEYCEAHAAIVGQIVAVGEAIGSNFVRQNFNTAFMLGAMHSRETLWVQNLLNHGFKFCSESVDIFVARFCDSSFDDWFELFQSCTHQLPAVSVTNIGQAITSRIVESALKFHDKTTRDRLVHVLEAGFDVVPLQLDYTAIAEYDWGQSAMETVRALIQHKIDVSELLRARDARGNTILGFICVHSSMPPTWTEDARIADARLLIRAGADSAAPANEQQESSLVIASRWGHSKMVLALLDLGCNPKTSAPAKPFARTALQVACEGGYLDIVIILINHGADVNAEAGINCGVTALQAASINGYFKICQVLIGAGAKISAAKSAIQGRTAIDGAAENGRLDIVHYLLERYDGQEDMARVCRRARRYATRRAHAGVVALLDDRLAVLQVDQSATLQDTEESDLEEEYTTSETDHDDDNDEYESDESDIDDEDNDDEYSNENEREIYDIDDNDSDECEIDDDMSD